MRKYELEDYEMCKHCGHIGLLHGGSRGCRALSSLENFYGTICGCKIKRNLSLLPPRFVFVEKSREMG